MFLKPHLFLANLNYKVTDDDIKELISPFGEVVGIYISPKGIWALVRMLNEEDAWKALEELKNKDFLGRPLLIYKAKATQTKGELDENAEQDKEAKTIHGPGEGV